MQIRDSGWRFATALVGLDMSPSSDVLVEWLPNLRLLGTTTLILLHVVPEHIVAELLAGIVSVDKVVEEQRRKALGKLAEYASMLERYGFEVEVPRPKIGNPAGWIVRASEAYGADYIVLGSRGHGLLRELLLGSVVEEVLHASRKPLLIARIRRSPDGEPVQPPPLKGTVVAAIDFNLYLEDVYTCSVEVAEHTGNPLTLLHVLEPGEDPILARERLEKLAEKARHRGLAVNTRLLEGKPGKRIIEEAARLDAALIIVGPGLSRTSPIGATTETVVRRAQTNVLVCRRAPAVQE
ncbi:universal stress protein [Hyperthermus butylicus]|uniref:Universally conserved protein n=1 Tax=Hyperthermus butylicus (strain DSM 5456 / JCM 9403 / PLM1-5) TaxID=415426 RepID=A2BKF8_HYPBU|nr:universal stress protein [Hyperthermus butylicus]ABM80469.1 universally conserved protein [Hyperthermus butylicus DSM 5456]